MPYSEIKNAVEQLHRELSTPEPINPESADLLRQALFEIENALALKSTPPIGPLESWLVDFGDHHPQASKWTRTIIDQVTALGM